MLRIAAQDEVNRVLHKKIHPEPARPSTPQSGARDEGAESKDA